MWTTDVRVAARAGKVEKKKEKERGDAYLRVAIASELRRLAQQAPAEPRPVPLPLVRHHLHLQPPAFGPSASRFRRFYPVLDKVPYVAL